MSKWRRGITGLETAIILIAFVIVASVFAFAILNMGLSATQKAGSAVESGVKQASSSLELGGSVIAYGNTTSGNATKIIVYIKLAPGKEPIDTSQGKLLISYTNARVHIADARSVTGAVTVSEVSGTGDGDTLLEKGEVFEIQIDLTTLDSNAPLSANEWFKVEIKPPVGAILSVERTMPASIDPVMDLG